MQTLVNMFAKLFRDVAFVGGFQWNTIISILIFIEMSELAGSWNQTNVSIPEDLMASLLKKGYYEYFMSGKISDTLTKEDITLNVFSQFLQFYELIDILISLFHSNAFDDKQCQNEFRCIAVSKVYNLIGEEFLKNKLLMKFLFEKSFSLFCNKHKELGIKPQALNIKTVSSYEQLGCPSPENNLIQIVYSQFINCMKKFVDNPNTECIKKSRPAKIKHNKKVLDYEMDHLPIPGVVNN